MARRSTLLRAELAVAELEEKLVAAKKAAGTKKGLSAGKYAELKADVREARRQFREAKHAES